MKKKPRPRLEWLLAHVSYDGDDCLIFPFTRTASGYGEYCIGSTICLAHRFMCHERHGPAPTPEHQAAHTCGRGHDGCVNPKHLAWKTRSENQLDRRRHGTSSLGKSSRRLTAEQVAEIRTIADEKPASIARRYGVALTTIRDIRSGKAWKSAQHP